MRADRTLLAAAGLFVLAALLLAWPLRHGAPYLDDYLFLALGRHLDAPWPLLLSDSAGTFFFRPVVMFLWWLSVRLLGTDGGPHLVLGVLVHAANGALLAVLLARLGIGRAAATLAGLALVVHPTAFAASAWLSDRFDLFATLFGLGALIVLERQVREPRSTRLACGLVLLALALLSKEIAFAFAAVAFMLVLTRLGWRATWRLPAARAAAAGVAGLTVAALAIRPLVLRNASDMFLEQGVAMTLAAGTLKWFRYLPEFLFVWHGNAVAVFGFMALVAALLGLGAWTLRTANGRASFRAMACVGAALLMLLAVVAEAPIVRASPLVPFTAGFSFEALAGSRFWYVPLVGLAGVLAALGDGIARATPLRARQGMSVLVVAVLVAMAASSRAIGREWMRFLADGETPVRAAAVDVARRIEPSPHGCKLYFLGTPEPLAGFRVLVDANLKSALPRGHAALACFIQAEHTPWYHVMGRVPRGSEAPLEVILFAGRPYEPLDVGNLTLYFLKATRGDAIAADPGARFFAWRAPRFEEVTGDVRSGALRPKFHDNR